MEQIDLNGSGIQLFLPAIQAEQSDENPGNVDAEPVVEANGDLGNVDAGPAAEDDQIDVGLPLVPFRLEIRQGTARDRAIHAGKCRVIKRLKETTERQSRALASVNSTIDTIKLHVPGAAQMLGATNGTGDSP